MTQRGEVGIRLVIGGKDEGGNGWDIEKVAVQTASVN